MPFYEYQCARCGDFRALRPMRESDLPQPCPDCEVPCERMLAAPFLAAGSGAWLGKPRTASAGGSWRSMCGFGCSHAGCQA
jgi:putative FmdB family regulatory protein